MEWKLNTGSIYKYLPNCSGKYTCATSEEKILLWVTSHFTELFVKKDQELNIKHYCCISSTNFTELFRKKVPRIEWKICSLHISSKFYWTIGRECGIIPQRVWLLNVNCFSRCLLHFKFQVSLCSVIPSCCVVNILDVECGKYNSWRNIWGWVPIWVKL